MDKWWETRARFPARWPVVRLHILQTVNELTDHGVILVSVTDGIDSSTPAGCMMIGVLESLAEYERELTIERTALKRSASRAIATQSGRPRKVDVGRRHQLRVVRPLVEEVP